MGTKDLLEAIAAVIDAKKDAIGLTGGAHYPALNTVPVSPIAFVRTSRYLPSTIEKPRAGQQRARLGIDVLLLVRSSERRPQDAARLDGLIEPILDLFDANLYGGNVNGAFAGHNLPGNVERVWHEAVLRTMPIDYGEAGYCHAAILTLDAEFARKAVMP